MSDDGSEMLSARGTDTGEDLELPSMELIIEEPPLELALKPLPPPSIGSPFTKQLSFMHKDPSESQHSRDAALRRKVQQMLRQIYRRSVEASGSIFRGYEPPWPPKEKPDELPRVSKAPLLCQLALPRSKSLAGTKAERSKVHKFDGDPSRQAALKAMASFGRGAVGGPYTLRQVYEEVEADVHHRRPADVRAMTGRLGPRMLGPGTTTARRKLPFAHPQMLPLRASTGRAWRCSG
ncbi:unnamed protein product, partial [Effrenium voratum]